MLRYRAEVFESGLHVLILVPSLRLLFIAVGSIGSATDHEKLLKVTDPNLALRQDGIDIRTLQQWMGHRDIASTWFISRA
jgi:hypothetical protein